jgi:LacI family transcriptional regulator
MANSSLKDIAAALSVSESTVSRVLNGVGDQYRIGKSTQQKILTQASVLRYQPNLIARSLRLNRSNTVGLVIPDISNPFFAKIAHSIEQEARDQGYFILLSVSQEDTDQEKKAIRQLMARQIDGLIVSPVGQEQSHLLNVPDNALPMVLIDRCFKGQSQPFVVSDNFHGGFLAADHLIQYGHRKIACIQGLRHTSPTQDRLAGLMAAHQKHQLSFNNSLLLGDSFGMENGYESMKQLLSLPAHERPTAVFAMSNLISLGVLEALHEQGLTIPEDMSVVAFDEHPYSRFLASPMTTVEQDYHQMGIWAVRNLLGQIRQEGKKETQITIPVQLNIRQSVKRIIHS